MTELDQALENLRHDMNDATCQSKFYDLFLNATFYVPTLGEKELAETGDAVGEGEVMPLVIEAEGHDYLMLFDTKDRLLAWAQTEAGFVEVPGHVLAATTMPPLRWALNVGTAYSKSFLSDEIAWLREVVERCNEAAGEHAAKEEGR